MAALALRRRPRLVVVSLLILLALCEAAWSYRQRFQRSELRVTFLSVGQGDSAVVECPGSKVIVVDGGGLGDGSFDVGERLIAPFLWGRKIGHVDALAMTHPQWDHYGGLTFLAEHFTPEEFWWNGDEAHGSVRFAALRKTLAATGTRDVILRGGVPQQCGDAIIRVLEPVTRQSSPNDRSLVLQLQRGLARVLLAGDIEGKGEAAILRAAGGLLESTVLKVPHHGSQTSSSPAFVTAVAPRVAIASLGFRNSMGFPHKRTVATYARVGAILLRTDLDGAISVKIDRSGNLEASVFRSENGADYVFATR